MPIIGNPFDSPNAQRLKLGQGVPGGNASLPDLGGPSSLPRPSVAPGRGLPLGPPAQDVTPQRPVASAARLPSTEGRGAALLRRGWPNIVAGSLKPPGPGVTKTLKLLQDPDRLFQPGNRRQLNLIMKPGPNVQAMIDQNPQLKANQQGLQNHVLTKGPGVKLPAQDIIKKLHDTVGTGKMDMSEFVQKNKVQLMGMDDESKRRFAAAADVAIQTGRNKLTAQGKQVNAEAFGAPVQRVYDSNIFGNAFAQGFDTITGMVPGAIQAVRHPVGTAEAVAHSTSQYYGPLFHGDVGKFAHNVSQQPLTLGLDVMGAGGAALGAAGRIGAVSDALASRGAAAAVEDLGNGAARVGGRYTVHPMKNGRAMVRDQNTNSIVTNMPSAEAAIAHAQSLGSDMAHQSALRTAIKAFANPGLYGKTRGGLLDQLESHSKSAQARIDAENKQIIEEIGKVSDNPNLKLSRRSLKEVYQAAKADMAATMNDMRHGPNDILAHEPAFYNRGTAALRHGAVQGYRELLSAVRLGAIYLRPAYLPNNWAGNAFMNLTHQGFLAPVNLAKSVVMHNHMDARNLAMLDKSMGQSAAAAAYEGMPRGFLASAGHPVMEAMGKMADQPFRRAAFLHEARRAGYSNLKQVDDLFNKFKAGDTAAQNEVANIARRAQEEIVKFGHLNPTERSVASNVFFVYNWVKGASRYAARYPLQHPIQADVYNKLAPEGHKWVDQQMGGVPWFLAGSIPIGHKANGDPILINPFALNPLGTSVDVARAAAGTWKALHHTGEFNKYADSSLVDLTNPLVNEAIKAMTGQNPNVRHDLEQSMAPVRLAQDLQHPGRGSMFPMTRTEALGHYIFGSLYPRRADQGAIERALERQNQGNPQKMLDNQIAQYTQATGQKPDDKLISQVRADVDTMQQIKDFQRHYANSIGSQGFKNLPPKNKAEAGLEYLQQTAHLPADAINNLRQAVEAAPNDAVLNELSNSIWGMTNAGVFKRQWDSMVKDVQPPKLTKARK